VRRRRAKPWFLREEGGFTLPELLVTMLMMLTVLFALYGIFDASIRIFEFGNDKVEAVENARLGLERIEREVRAAYPVNGDASPKYLLFTANGTRTAPPVAPSLNPRQITFGNERNIPNSTTGDGKIDCNPENVAANNPAYTPCEYITYRLNNQSGPAGATRTLLRNNEANGSDPATGGDPVVEYVDGINGLTFTYLKGDGTAAATEAEVQSVRIELRIKVPGSQPGTQTLTTDVDLRNREP
jgi:type II secretory pathway component PulJ